MSTQLLEKQIFLIEKNIKDKKVKNVYAATNKVSNLKAQLFAAKKANMWNDFLSR